jgi:glycosyltransferase involved in cell wall biosynthesis
MLKVAFSNQVFLTQKFGGASRYYCELFSALIRLGQIDCKIIAPIHFNTYLNELSLPGNLYSPVSTSMFRFNSMSQRISKEISSIRLRKYNPDLIHQTYYAPYQKFDSKKIIILTVFDMIHEKFSPYSKIINAKHSAINNADHIICISNSTKYDLMEIYGVDENKISVIGLGVSKIFTGNSQTKVLGSRKRMLVFVGQRNGYKNFDSFIKAYAFSDFLRNNFQITVFGGGEFTNNEIDLFKVLKVSNNIIKMDGNDSALNRILTDSIALVYPSKYEGFGIPILEAMAAGCIVFSSNTSSMPEAGGSSAIYFDPNSVDMISEVIESNLQGDLKSLDVIQKSAVLWSKEFSWDICALKTNNVYRMVSA